MGAYIAGFKRFEHNILTYLHVFSNNSRLHSLVLSLTNLGGVMAQIILILIFSLIPQTRDIGIKLAAAHICTCLPVQILKILTARPRPYQAFSNILNKGPELKDHSFPSGHTTSAFTSAIIISSAYPVLTPFLFLLATIIGLTRLILGVHYPTDVLIGSLIGTIISLFVNTSF